MDQVVAERVVKSYGDGRADRRILDGAELTVAAGEFVAVLGRSGSGKSTLLHLLGGLDQPDTGSIQVAGLHLGGLSEAELTRFRRQQVGFVFQLFHLIPELTGEENVLLPARLGGRAAVRRGRRLLARMGLDEAGRRLPQALSGGEQQRVAIARALVNEPAVVLADEPTGNLDREAAILVLEILQRIAAEGRSVVLATHDREAAGAADRVMVLEDGRLRG